MAFGFVAILLLSINESAHAVGLKPNSDDNVVRTHGAYHEQAEQSAHVAEPVLRVHKHKDRIADFAVDGKGEAQVFEESEPEVPPVVLQDKPRTPIIFNPKAAANLQLANELASNLVVRSESNSMKAAAVGEKPPVSEAVDVSGEAVQNHFLRSRAKKQSANDMGLEAAIEKQGELPETDSAPGVVRSETHPTGLSEMSGQWPPSGAATETHVVLLFLVLGIAAAVLAFAGICGGFDKAEPKGPRKPHDILAEVYQSATSPGVAATTAPEPTQKTGAFMTPV